MEPEIANPVALPPTAFHKPSFRAGVLAVLPLIFGTVPFGAITGVLMINAGIGPWDGWVMSAALMSGAAQVAAVDLMTQNAPAVIIALTGLIINMRFMMYSATIGPYMRGVQPLRKTVLSYMLSDQSFALSVAEFNRPGTTFHQVSYFAGASVGVFVIWMVAVTLGIILGAAVPSSLQLDFAIPLTFLTLLIPAFRERSQIFAALVAGLVAILANGLPTGLGLMAGAVAGIAAGFILAKKSAKQDSGNTAKNTATKHSAQEKK
ncbi:AzlC family ABC transporter permease [Desulfovibrio sp. OttesenSCG-928-C06]|nr:AzlC family ABC transporter permease [Desulfovibrio sp. OttesenSCG-928-C06]